MHRLVITSRLMASMLGRKMFIIGTDSELILFLVVIYFYFFMQFIFIFLCLITIHFLMIFLAFIFVFFIGRNVFLYHGSAYT